MRDTSPTRLQRLTVRCHVRAPLLLEPIDAKIATLRQCERQGAIRTLSLRSWPDAVTLGGDGPDSEIVDRFERFERWADANDVTIRPPFRIRTTSSMVSDRERRVLVTPVCCLALYDGDALVGVYPHTDGEITRTATDAIGALATGERPSPVTETVPAVPTPTVESGGHGTEIADRRWAASPTAPTVTACPDCTGPLVNVQGILSCGDCRWTDAELDALASPRAKLVYLSLVDGPKSVDALRSVLDLRTGTVYAILRTLVDRELVERTDGGGYRLQNRAERDAAEIQSTGQ